MELEAHKTQTCDLKTVEVLQEVCAKFNIVCGEGPDAETAVAGGELAAVTGEEDDIQHQDKDNNSMNCLDDVLPTLPKAKPKNNPVSWLWLFPLI